MNLIIQQVPADGWMEWNGMEWIVWAKQNLIISMCIDDIIMGGGRTHVHTHTHGDNKCVFIYLVLI